MIKFIACLLSSQYICKLTSAVWRSIIYLSIHPPVLCLSSNYLFILCISVICLSFIYVLSITWSFVHLLSVYPSVSVCHLLALISHLPTAFFLEMSVFLSSQFTVAVGKTKLRQCRYSAQEMRQMFLRMR